MVVSSIPSVPRTFPEAAAEGHGIATIERSTIGFCTIDPGVTDRSGRSTTEGAGGGLNLGHFMLVTHETTSAHREVGQFYRRGKKVFDTVCICFWNPTPFLPRRHPLEVAFEKAGPSFIISEYQETLDTHLSMCFACVEEGFTRVSTPSLSRPVPSTRRATSCTPMSGSQKRVRGIEEKKWTKIRKKGEEKKRLVTLNAFLGYSLDLPKGRQTSPGILSHKHEL